MGEHGITMVDVLQQEKELEEESAAVLGGSDEKCCTFLNGYVKRQALYSCLTCFPQSRNDAKQRAGICLACSYQCHENHELVELYTKRNFRCDCPTIRFGRPCTFQNSSCGDNKFPLNEENKYNQNFSGLYCTCSRPYPDPDDSVPDEMIQCIICEDWYHGRHLDTVVPAPDAYSEMICGMCMNSYEFLKDYVGISVNKVEKTNEETDVSVTEDDEKLKSVLDKSISDILNMSGDVKENASESTGEPDAKKFKTENENICKRPAGDSEYIKGGIFWPENWRKELCSCSKCIELYKQLGVSFLLDPEDTVHFYEENGVKNSRESDYERGIRALSSMDRVQQIDVISGYNQMMDKLKEFLHTFVVSQKVVTEQDINTFFQNMKNEKNQRTGPPNFCR